MSHYEEERSEQDEKRHQDAVARYSFLEEKISKISSRDKLIHLILASNDFLERKLAFLKYDQLLIAEIKKGDK